MPNDLIRAITNLNKIRPNNRPSNDPSNYTLPLQYSPAVNLFALSHTKLPKDPAKLLYYALVWGYTETNAPNVKGIELRGKDYHLDHIMPISWGYRNGILPAVIGGIDNPQILTHKQNFLKASKHSA